MGKERKQRSIEELQEASNRLFYEWKMITGLTNKFESKSMGDQMQKNAFIESFVIHARIVRHFLFGHQFKLWDIDVVAVDFFKNPEEWPKKCPSVPNELRYESFLFFANKQIAHISTTSKKDVHLADHGHKDWNLTEITDALQPAYEMFIRLVGPEYLGERWWTLLNDQTDARWDELKRLVAIKKPNS